MDLTTGDIGPDMGGPPPLGGGKDPAWRCQPARTTAVPMDPRMASPVAVPIWRDPWMVVGARTFTGDVLARLGLDNVFGAGPDRYPHVEAGQIRAAAPDLILLPDEPYRFTPEDGPEEFPAHRVVLVPGRLLTWYGPSLATARTDLLSAIG